LIYQNDISINDNFKDFFNFLFLLIVIQNTLFNSNSYKELTLYQVLSIDTNTCSLSYFSPLGV